MNTSDFPNYSQFLAVAHAQSVGAVLVGLIVLAGLIWLLMARLTWPKILPALRIILIGAFYLSLGVLLIGVR